MVSEADQPRAINEQLKLKFDLPAFDSKKLYHVRLKADNEIL